MTEPSLLQVSHLALYFLTALLVGLLLARSVMGFFLRIKWVDETDDRKKHNGKIPLSGGLLVLSTVAITVLLCQLWWGFDLGLAVSALIVFAVGLYDDRFPLRARYRFLAHLAAAVILIFSSATIVRYLGLTFGPVPVGLGILAVPFTMIGITGLINAYNMVDGADGLSGGQLFSATFWLIIAACAVPVVGTNSLAIDQVGPVLLPLAGALLAFLAFNVRGFGRKRAAMFLGDGGSMMMGLIIAWAVIHLTSSYGMEGFGAASALWLVALPLIDMFSAIIRRVMDGRTPMSPDRQHMHHLLFDHGLSVGKAVIVLNVLGFCMGAVGVLGWMAEIPQYFLFWGLMTLFIGYVIYAHRFWQAQSRLAQGQQGVFKPETNRA